MKIKLKFILFLSFIVFEVLFVGTNLFASSDKVKWHSYDEGIHLAKIEKKKIFISFHANWCTYCKKMDKNTFTDKSVISYLNKNYICIKVDYDREKNIVSKYNVKAIPDTWFVTEKGEGIGNQLGYLSPKKLLLMLKYVHTDSYKTMKMSEFISRLSK